LVIRSYPQLCNATTLIICKNFSSVLESTFGFVAVLWISNIHPPDFKPNRINCSTWPYQQFDRSLISCSPRFDGWMRWHSDSVTSRLQS